MDEDVVLVHIKNEMYVDEWNIDESLSEGKSEEGQNKVEAEKPSTSDCVIVTLNLNEITKLIIEKKYSVEPVKFIDRKRSGVWKIFGRIISDAGDEVKNVVACMKCYKAVNNNFQTTSNLKRHKCYTLFESRMKKKLNTSKIDEDLGSSSKIDKDSEFNFKDIDSTSSTKEDVDPETKKDILKFFVKWTIQNCSPFLMNKDDGMKHLFEFMMSVGAKCGQNVDVEKLIPKRSNNISWSISKLSEDFKLKIKSELLSVKEVSFSSYLWATGTDLSYICLSVHYIYEGKYINRVLGITSIDKENNKDAKKTIQETFIPKIISDFGLNYNSNSILVANEKCKIGAFFKNINTLNCINHLLSDAIKDSIEDIKELNEVVKTCSKIVKELQKKKIRASLEICPKNYNPNDWNTIYYLLESIEKNWTKIMSNKVFVEKDEIRKIGNLTGLTQINNFLKNFAEMSKKLESTNCITIHLIYTCVHYLKKTCIVQVNDCELLKQLKQKIHRHIDEGMYPNLSISHKIGLFLFPPTNSLRNFTPKEKLNIISKCKELMAEYLENEPIQESPQCKTSESSDIPMFIFDDFIAPQNDDKDRRIEHEINIYSNMNVHINDQFDAIKWWDANKDQYPLLYKLSQKILSIPATTKACERVFAKAKNLILGCCNPELDINMIDSIIFLSCNSSNSQLSYELRNLIDESISIE